MKLFKRKRFVPYTTSFRGHTLHVHDRASFRLGKNELFKEEVYKFTAGRSDPFIIDCGSNIGMSILFFKSLYPAATIVGFEADPYIFSFLEKNVNSYALGNVTVINRAVWNAEDETLSFLAEGGAGGRLEERSGESKYIDVKTARLKNYVTREVDFLKLDIEGAEHKVIADCADELKLVKHLFIEYHSMPGREQNLHQILEIANKAGFRYHIKEAYTTTYPLIERKLNVGMDLQLNIFCYRV
jgi:FkbM family methyltransferase